MGVTEYLLSDDIDLRNIGIELVKNASREDFLEMLFEYNNKKKNNLFFRKGVTDCFWDKAIEHKVDYYTGSKLESVQAEFS